MYLIQYSFIICTIPHWSPAPIFNWLNALYRKCWNKNNCKNYFRHDALVNFYATEKLLAQSLHRKRLDYLIRCSLEQEWQFISMNCSMTKKFLFNGKKKSRRLSSTKELLYKIVCECIIYLNCSWQNNFIWN